MTITDTYIREKVRQGLLILTELDLDKALWPAMANAISERLSGSESLFESDPIISRYADLVMTKYQVRSDVKDDRDISFIKPLYTWDNSFFLPSNRW